MEQAEGWLAVWICTINNSEDLDRYTKDVWTKVGDREMSSFAKEFGIARYDPDLREFDVGNGDANNAEFLKVYRFQNRFSNPLFKGCKKVRWHKK